MTAPEGTTAVSVPLDLLYRIDSITSLIYYRERKGGISDESAAELLAVSTEVRKITKWAERTVKGERCCICAPNDCEGQDESGEHGCVFALDAAASCCADEETDK